MSLLKLQSQSYLEKDLEGVFLQMNTVSTSFSGLGLWQSKFQHNFCFVVGLGFYNLCEWLLR